MPRYMVYVRETWIQGVQIEATNKGEAIAKILEGEGENIEDSFEYSDTRDESEWTVRELNE